MSEISCDEVEEATKGLGMHRAAGADKIVNEFFKCRQVACAITEVFNKWIQQQHIDKEATVVSSHRSSKRVTEGRLQTTEGYRCSLRSSSYSCECC